MISIVASLVVYTLGLLFAPSFVAEIRLKSSWKGLQTATTCGLCSVVLGKLFTWILAITFFPVLLLGPLFPLLVQFAVNMGVLRLADMFTDELTCSDRRACGWVAAGLACLQMIARYVVTG